MNKIKAVATLTGGAALLATAFSGVASAHVHMGDLAATGAFPTATNLVVCTNHGAADIVVSKVDGNGVETVVGLGDHGGTGDGGCHAFALGTGDYLVGTQEEKEEEPPPCRAAGDSVPAHAAYPKCFEYGYYLHHIEVDQPGEGQYPGAKFQPPLAHVFLTAQTGTPQLGNQFCDTATIALPSVYSGTPPTCTGALTLGSGGNDPLGIGTEAVQNVTVVILHMHQAYGHI